MGFIGRIGAFLKFVVAAGPLARSLKGDVVFATSTPLTIILPALFATVGRRTPIVFEVRDLWPEMPIALGYLRNPLLKSLARALERLAYRSSRRIIALSEDMAAGVEAVGTPAGKIVVAPNACDLATFDIPEEVGNEFRQRTPWLGDRPFVVYCGSLGPLYDIRYLVRVATAMRKINPEVVFGIYGVGKEEPKIRLLATELQVLDVNVFLMGAIPKREVPIVLSAASVVSSIVIPITEVQGNSANKFFDGLAAARPLAINYEGWQADVLRSTGAGIVLSKSDPVAAATQLADLLSDAARLATARLAARKLALRYSRDKISNDILKTLEDAVLAESAC